MTHDNTNNEGETMTEFSNVRRMTELKLKEFNGQLTREEIKELNQLRSLTPAQLHR